MDADSERDDQHEWKILGPGSVTPTDLFLECQLFWKFKCENVIQKMNLLRPSYEPHIGIYPIK
jgi:hypothetical protein